MSELPEYVGGLPNLCGAETQIESARRASRGQPVFKPESRIDFGGVKSAFAIALHMHQPLIPAGGSNLATAEIISNLKHMMDNPGIGDNHNASVFHWCYKRMGEFIPQLVDEGKQPRVMLEYSGTLLHGLRQMGLNDVFDNLKRITCDPRYRTAVEWLGGAWGHPVAPSTPVQDFRLHVTAWLHHFAAIFGLEAMGRVRGFSPAEMALPNHPDTAYEFVKTLKDCGYQWVLVQEHTVERPENGQGPERKHLPHRLVCRNARGRGGRHHRHHQDAGQRHQIGRADAALLRGQGAVPLGPRRQTGPAVARSCARKLRTAVHASTKSSNGSATISTALSHSMKPITPLMR